MHKVHLNSWDGRVSNWRTASTGTHTFVGQFDRKLTYTINSEPVYEDNKAIYHVCLQDTVSGTDDLRAVIFLRNYASGLNRFFGRHDFRLPSKPEETSFGVLRLSNVARCHPDELFIGKTGQSLKSLVDKVTSA